MTEVQEPARSVHAAPLANLDLFVQLGHEIDPSSRTPLYEQIGSAVSALIASDLLPPGTMLPPEQELATLLGVGRQTINQALAGLAEQGMVRRRRGVGTVVSPRRVDQPLNALYSFMQTLLAQGRIPTTRLLGYRPVVRDPISLVLTGDSNGLLFELARLRLVDGEPTIVEMIYLPEAMGQRVPLDRVTSEPFYEILQDCCGVTVTHAQETLRPMALRARHAALLQGSRGDPAFLVERTAYAGEQAVEVRRSVIRGDRYRFQVQLDGPTLTRHDL